MSVRASVREYYDATWLDYRLLWMTGSHALHFGYWDETTRSHGEALVNMNRALATRVGLRPGERVLDAGCGVGGSAVWLAKTYGVEVVGITTVESQVARAERYALATGVAERVAFLQRDYARTRFADASFDVVWAMESACHASDKPRFLAEARRLLRPGGRLGMAEYMGRSRPYAMDDGALLQRWLSGWAIPDLASGEEWLRWASAAGFEALALEDITLHVVPSLRRLYRLARLCWPLAVALRACGLRSAVQHANSRGARDQWLALQRGLWFYALFTATTGANLAP